MGEKLKRLYAQYGDMLRYLIVGGVTTLLDFGTFTLLNVLLGVHPQVANIIGWIVAVVFAFVGNKWIVFRSQTRERGALMRETFSFLAMRILTLLFSAAFLYITITLMGWNEPAAKLVSTIFVVILNYVLSRLVVFRKPDDQKQSTPRE